MPPAAVTPDTDILVNGAALPPGAARCLVAVEVQETLDVLSMFTLTLSNWNPRTLAPAWSDDPLFSVGHEVTIALGVVGEPPRTVLTGEITGLEVVFEAAQRPLLLVRGYDHRHRLARGRRTATYAAMTDSTIAASVARAAGLRAQVRDSRVALEHVLQDNQSDLEFLRDRARRIGYEVFVRDKVLHFRPPAWDAAPVLTLDATGVSSFTARLSTMGQAGTTVVRGWDPAAKAPVRATVTAPTSTMRGATTGGRAADTAFGRAEDAAVGADATSRTRAASMAAGRFDARAGSYVEGRARCRGRSVVRAGTVVEIEHAGTTFSGPYYVTAVTHTLDAEGYWTTFDARRTAA